MSRTVKLPYNFQEYEWEIDTVNAYKRGLEIWMNQHRRSGKDLLCFCRFLLPPALKNPGTYHYIWPTLKEGRDGFWEGKDEEGRDILDYYVPPGAILKKDNQDMKLFLKSAGGTSLIQVFGTNGEQWTALRGKPGNGAVFSEYAYQDPRGLAVVSPMIVKTKGFLVFNSTPNGQNHFQQGYDLAVKNTRKCFAVTKNVTQTYDHFGNRLITEEEIEEERKKGRSEDFINQDYYCSFNQGIEGTYIGRALQQLKSDGRITVVPYHPSLLVDTYWDLGGDKMTVWFVQQLGKELRFIDYEEATGSTFGYWAKLFQEKKYLFGQHHAPFDVGVHEMVGKEEKAETRLDWAAKVGINFVLVPDASFQNCVDAARGILPLCWFDEVKTKPGRVHLEQWGRVWNNIEQRYTDNEKRDLHTHAGAAFRYAAVSIREAQGYDVGKSSDEKSFKRYYGGRSSRHSSSPMAM